ncbi:MAG: metallopeptidase family protein [Eggerthellaceae bacterium]|nr:metallopeptidase family protein [Eggerthellaceae bacterium]
MFKITEAEFEEAVQDALDSIPDEFLNDLENVAILVADEPTEDQLEGPSDGYWTEDDDLLGLYEGVDLGSRGDDYGFGDFPDTITIFKGPHERLCNSRAEIREEIRRTVVHEIAHYFGMDEDQVDDMGYA